jgi:DNA excision repair protein ERCC-4
MIEKNFMFKVEFSLLLHGNSFPIKMISNFFCRILTVDFLTDRIPIDLITGLLVYRAHRITDSSSESFIIRLYRDKNKTGFIKGFSDSSLDFSRGYNQLECVMKNLFLRHVYLYPRFQITVRSTFENCSPDVIELQVPLTLLMMDIQVSLMELINACLQELRSSTTWIDNDILTADQAILSSFERLIRLQLQPIWNQVSIRTKQLLNDIKTLRLFVLHLTQYDCVTFYNAVQAVFINEKLYGSRGKNIHSSQGSTGSWLYLPAADRLLTVKIFLDFTFFF